MAEKKPKPKPKPTEVKPRVYELSHARHDPAHCMCPGLFRPIKDGDRKRLKLDVKYQYGDESLHFMGPEPLDVLDMRVLQGIVAMAGPNGLLLDMEPESEGGKQLRLLLDLKMDAVQKDALVVKNSYSALTREVGLDPNDRKSRKRVIASVKRLYMVTVWARKRGQEQGFRILSEYQSDDIAQKLFCALNPRIAAAVLGGAGTAVAYINMNEARALGDDKARVLHQYLSAWIGPGRAQKATLETLMAHVWPDIESYKQGTIDVYKSRLRKSIIEIGKLRDWMVTEYAKDKYFFKRRKGDF